MKSAHAECFACGPRNPNGLKLLFRPVGRSRVSCECTLGEGYQGYPGVVQGGVVSTLLDSAMTNCLFADGIRAVTARLNVRFREPVMVGCPVTVAACVVRQRGKLYELKASVLQDGKQKAVAEGRFLGDRTRGEEEFQWKASLP